MIAFFQSLSWSTWLIIGIVLAGLATGGIILIVRGDGWKDNGFMKTADGRDYFWPAYPLRLYVEHTVPKPYLSELKVAIARLESLVGKTLFQPAHVLTPDEVPREIQVLVAYDKDAETSYTRHQVDLRTGQVLSAYMCFKGGLAGNDLDVSVAHELGHTVNLAHDEKTGSYMHPVIQQRAQHYTDKDIKRLQKARG